MWKIKINYTNIHNWKPSYKINWTNTGRNLYQLVLNWTMAFFNNVGWWSKQYFSIHEVFWEGAAKIFKTYILLKKTEFCLIRYCLSIVLKSVAVYDNIRCNEKTGTGFLILPSRRRVQHCKKYVRLKRGINNEIICEFLKKVTNLSDNEKCFVLLMDETEIQESLVWDKHTVKT